jgi:poly(beta-D-mannuronate) lyase
VKPFVLIAALTLPVAAHADCDPVPAPVIEVSHGSRYTEDSKTRSDFDEKGEAEIEAALGPIDQYIIDLANLSNRALRKLAEEEPEQSKEAATCLVDAVAAWAKADALSKVEGDSANLSTPSRIGGIATNYALTRDLAEESPEQRAATEAWLATRADRIVTFFDTLESMPRAKNNNLRGWAALAVTQIGVITKRQDLIDWGIQSANTMICNANPDGSLPLELERGRLSLHYQIHATTPLVMIASLAKPQADLLETCDGGLGRIVTFTLQAIEKPQLVEAMVGQKQRATVKPGELAFLLPWLTLTEGKDELAARMANELETFSNSKLGGDLSLRWDLPAIN